MELPGHVGLALLLYAPVAYLAISRGRAGRAGLGLLGVLALSMTPDVDLLVAGVAHRGVTHTVWAAVLAAAVVGLATAVVTPGGGGIVPGRSRFGAIVGGTGVGSHLLGDVITPMGIRPLHPLSETSYTLALANAADPEANLTLLVVGAVAYGTALTLARSRKPTPEPTPAIDPESGSRA